MPEHHASLDAALPDLLPITEVDRSWRPGRLDPIELRLWRRVGVVDTGCWEWTGALNIAGYGRIRLGGRTVGTHRAAYELLVGPIPDGLVLDHLCRNIICCNPEHLEPVTQRVNTHRGISPAAINAAKTTCIQGHLFDEGNTLIDYRGRRRCRACARNWARDKYRADRIDEAAS